MECNTVRAQLAALLDDELTPDEAQAVNAHLAHCARCAHEFAAIQSLYQLADAWDMPNMPVENDLWPSLELMLLRKEIALLREASLRMQAENARLRAEVTALRQQAATSPPLTTPVLFPTEAAPPNLKVWL